MNIVFIIHVTFFLLALLVPVFSRNQQVLVTYAYAMPLTMFHWLTNNDKCCLTLLEQKITGKPVDKLFFERVFAPIYTKGDQNIAYRMKFVFLTLWLVTMFRIVGMGVGLDIKLPGNVKVRI